VIGPERATKAEEGDGGGAPPLPRAGSPLRVLDRERVINAVGGHGGGAPPLPPIQNKPLGFLL